MLYAIYGSSGFGREVMPVLRQQIAACPAHTGPHECVFVDDDPAAPALVNGHRVLGWDPFLAEPAAKRAVAIAIANSTVRATLAARCSKAGIEPITVCAANVVRMDGVVLGEGAIVQPFVTLSSNIRIGRQFHANIYSYVAHDCVIGDFVTFAPGVKCNGNVVIEDHAYIGAGAILRQGKPGAPLVIGRGAVVGMGAVVTKSVPAGVTVVGNPARPLSKPDPVKG